MVSGIAHRWVWSQFNQLTLSFIVIITIVTIIIIIVIIDICIIYLSTCLNAILQIVF